ncbi:MAG: hypothetical protein FD169_1994 [Bacillota bacterium]|nr:MAG: hypothetical protein FD169_1994 [Bacillota bacterium]
MLRVWPFLLKTKVSFFVRALKGMGVHLIAVAFAVVVLISTFGGYLGHLSINYELAYALLVLAIIAKKLIFDRVSDVHFSLPSLHFLVNSPVDTSFLIGVKLIPLMMGTAVSAVTLEYLAVQLGGWEVSHLRTVGLVMLLSSVFLIRWLLYNVRRKLHFGVRILITLALWLIHRYIVYSPLLLAPLILALFVLSMRDVSYVNWPKLTEDSRYIYLTPRLFLASDYAGMQRLHQERRPSIPQSSLLSRCYFKGWKAVSLTQLVLLFRSPWQVFVAYLGVALGVDWLAPNTQPLGLALLLLMTINTIAPSCSCILEKRLQGFSLPTTPLQLIGALMVTPLLISLALVSVYMVLTEVYSFGIHTLVFFVMTIFTVAILTVARSTFMPTWGHLLGLAALAAGASGIMSNLVFQFYGLAFFTLLMNLLLCHHIVRRLGCVD